MLIRNATIITFGSPNKILPAYGLRIANGKVVDVGPSQEIVDRYPGEEIIDARGQYVLPGNICAHTHFYGAFARGMAIPGSAPKDFPEILSRLWWSLDKALTEDDIYFSALVCLVDAIKQGTTTLIDHNASPNQITGSLDVISKAVG
jgi:cytosine/adenosine deaminase-related metal-dependent hydrolase